MKRSTYSLNIGVLDDVESENENPVLYVLFCRRKLSGCEMVRKTEPRADCLFRNNYLFKGFTTPFGLLKKFCFSSLRNISRLYGTPSSRFFLGKVRDCFLGYVGRNLQV